MSNSSETHYEFWHNQTKIVVEKIKTRNGERISITDSETGESIKLDPLELESLTWQDENNLQEILNSKA